MLNHRIYRYEEYNHIYKTDFSSRARLDHNGGTERVKGDNTTAGARSSQELLVRGHRASPTQNIVCFSNWKDKEKHKLPPSNEPGKYHRQAQKRSKCVTYIAPLMFGGSVEHAYAFTVSSAENTLASSQHRFDPLHWHVFLNFLAEALQDHI